MGNLEDETIRKLGKPDIPTQGGGNIPDKNKDGTPNKAGKGASVFPKWKK